MSWIRSAGVAGTGLLSNRAARRCRRSAGSDVIPFTPWTIGGCTRPARSTRGGIRFALVTVAGINIGWYCSKVSVGARRLSDIRRTRLPVLLELVIQYSAPTQRRNPLANTGLYHEGREVCRCDSTTGQKGLIGLFAPRRRRSAESCCSSEGIVQLYNLKQAHLKRQSLHERPDRDLVPGPGQFHIQT